MNIIVTGGAGFIGSHVCGKLIGEGASVTVIDNFNDFYNPEIKRRNLAPLADSCRILEIDICDFESVRRCFHEVKPDLVIHLAARAGVRPSILDPQQYIDANITGTFNILESARLSGCVRMLFASSSSVYGASKNAPFREDQPLLQTLSPYAATKISGEHLCSNFVNLYGMRIVALRFFTVYGPGQRPDLAIHKFTSLIHEEKPIQQFGDGTTRRDYTYIDDIVDGVMRSVRFTDSSNPIFEIFNLGESETTSLTELILHLENAIGKQASIERLPEQKGDMRATYADISKARSLLGYSPNIPVKYGIPRFVEWYRLMTGI